MTRVLVVNGPNLNLLGEREPAIYGSTTLTQIESELLQRGRELGVEVACIQSNHEGELVDIVQSAPSRADGMIVNLGAYSHTSLAIRDALLAVSVPFIEVHLSNIHRREAIRRRSLTADLAAGVIVGLGARGYRFALEALAEIISSG